ncbi:rhomboid family intramembrane serine protease [Leptospira interrogans]|uniref:Peptidase, S54 family n=1 Tax=Leptospira interrogans serovar Lora str. TE 1992 TaxID=1193028 RepID=M3EX88_LEPIR|nr:rhomboid family intramembrane serine protease [Leptospira interrogans]AKH76600.1 peptidase [Leptospira interrogans serovar Bratislava]EMF42421.1 peptidase, S54 family [Leptospira interrogans serovar Lora str. TE 1992]EMN08609.1 peptidase, S54 family [Leptospira interrogans serovar Muenchen str. Brem 129]KLO75280.1 Peptidase, S54 family [Leptospira interrogans serovar Muenchen]
MTGIYNRIGPELTPVVRTLLILNGSIFAVQLLLSWTVGDYLTLYFGMTSDMITHHFFIWQFLTYAFLHSVQNFFHILFNMFSLWMFGSVLESYWGSRNFLKFYLFSCFMGGFFPWILHNVGFHQGTIIGASGGIYGLLIAFALIWPNQELLFMGFFPLKAKYMVVILMLIIAFSGSGSNIAHMAHLGGAIGGAIYFFYYNKLKSKIPASLSLSRYLQKRKMKKWQEEMNRKIHVREEVDQLLDKISKSGMNSLSRKEKKFLKEASSKYYSED